MKKQTELTSKCNDANEIFILDATVFECIYLTIPFEYLHVNFIKIEMHTPQQQQHQKNRRKIVSKSNSHSNYWLKFFRNRLNGVLSSERAREEAAAAEM